MLIAEKELNNIVGGGICWSIVAGMGVLITLIVGIADGQIKLKWQNRKNTEFKGNSEGKPLIQIRRKD